MIKKNNPPKLLIRLKSKDYFLRVSFFFNIPMKRINPMKKESTSES